MAHNREIACKLADAMATDSKLRRWLGVRLAMYLDGQISTDLGDRLRKVVKDVNIGN